LIPRISRLGIGLLGVARGSSWREQPLGLAFGEEGWGSTAFLLGAPRACGRARVIESESQRVRE